MKKNDYIKSHKTLETFLNESTLLHEEVWGVKLEEVEASKRVSVFIRLSVLI